MTTTIDMIRAVQKSAAFFKEEATKLRALVLAQQQENEKRESIELVKKKLSEEEDELMMKYKKLQSDQKVAQSLLDEGNKRLGNALRKGDFTDVEAAYALNTNGTQKIKSIDEEMTKIMDNVSIIRKKRARTEHEQAKKKPRLSLQSITIDEKEDS